MTTTFKELQGRVLKFIAMSDNSDARAEVKAYLNDAARDVWHAHPWQERKRRTHVVTNAPYTTGTATFTNGSTTLTGSGTTWTSGMVGRRVALSYDAPYYVVETFVSATELTLARYYVETTVSGSSYTIYDDVLDLGTMDTLLTNEVVVLSQGYDVPMADLTARDWSDSGTLPRSDGVPSAYRLLEDSGGDTVIQVWPVPDAAYAVQYTYLTPYVDMVSDSDVCPVPESRRDVVVSGALRWAYQYNEEYQKSQFEEVRFQRALALAWSRERRSHPQTSTLKPFDRPSVRQARTGNYQVDYP